jgi:ribokinase
MAKEPPHICVVGSSNMDLTLRAPRLPRPGETLAASGLQLGFGGKGGNQAVMAARLGARVTLVGRVGRDVFGEQMLAHYQHEEIDTTFLTVDESRPSGAAAIIVDESAQNCILVVPGANGALSPADVRAAADALRGADLLLCQLEVPLETTQEAFRLARDAGVRTVLNPSPMTPLPVELLRLTDLCVPNETEIELLTGRTVTTSEQADAAARALAGYGPHAVLLTLAERGALLVETEKVHPVPTPLIAAVDPTGAGDAFLGSLAVFWAQGLSLVDAARRACAVAALSVTRPGAQASFPSRQEAEAFLAQQGLM